jgi:hypothetical protein
MIGEDEIIEVDMITKRGVDFESCEREDCIWIQIR